jgi:type 1 glutamine amidotransferase
MTPRPPTAVVVLNGDDVYEDLFSAGLKLQEILTGQGFVTRMAMGLARATKTADLIVLDTAMGCFPPERQQALAEAVSAGTGLLAVHAANVFPAAQGRLDEDYRQTFELIGSRYASHGPPPHQSRFRVETSTDHPLTRGLTPFEITHEHYQVELAADAQVVAWRQATAGREPIAVVRQHGRGRVCYLQLGHDMRAWDDPPVRTLIARAALWTTSNKEAVAV